MTVGLLMNLACSDSEGLSIRSGLCKRVRFRQSDCRHCVDICPEHAIELSLGPSINDKCTQCGLCINVCPTEVFSNAKSTDVYLLEEIHALTANHTLSEDKKSLHIHCQEADSHHKGSYKVACLGNLTENVMLGAGLSGIDEMVLAKGECTKCRMAQGEKLLSNAMLTFRALQRRLGLESFTLRIEDRSKDKKSPEKLSRREFFSRIVENVKERTETDIRTAVPSNLHQHVNEDINQQPKQPSTRRALLRELLHEQTPTTQADILTEHLPWGIMQVDEENCIGCGICVAVCPTGALIKEYEESQLVRTYNSALCTSCSLCQEACPQQVIDFTEATNLREMVEDNPRVVARIDLNACLICGEIIPVKEGTICTTCEKRQISPAFM